MKSFIVALFLLIGIQLSAQITFSPDTAAKIEQVLNRYKSINPGIQVSISRNGALLFSKAYGMADLEHNVPLTTSSVIEAGSVSKQFTAAAVLLLEQQGKLSLEDDIRKFIPEIKNYGRPILIRNMIQHTSGLKDWGSVAAISGWPRSTKTYSNDDALYIIAHQKTLNNQPGDEFIYSNSNYNLMAILVQRVSGMNLADFSREHIFKPAGMLHTEWRADFRKIVPNRAIAYSKNGETYLANMPNEYVYGNGGLITTTEDLLRWNDYYTSGKLGNPSLLPKQVTSSKFTNGLEHYYAAGIFLEKFNGLQLWTHNGATAGYRANLDYFPSLQLSIAWLSNTSEFDRSSFNLTEALREIFVGRKNVPDTNRPILPIADFKQDLNKYTGWFKNTRSSTGLNLTVKNGAIVSATSSQPLVPVADNGFMMGSNSIRFFPGYQRFYLISTARDSILFTRMQAPDLTPAKMQEYVGEYYSDEAACRFIVRLKNNELVLIQEPSREFKLSPTYKDGFESPLGTILFEQNKNKKITKLSISIARARNIQFDKTK